MKVLLVTLYFPPAGGGGVQRPLKFATHLPALGIETHVLAPDDPKWVHRDDELVAADAGLDPPRPLRRAEGTPACGGAARAHWDGAGRAQSGADLPQDAGAGRERELEPDRGAGRDPHRQAGGNRRRRDHFAPDVRPSRGRRGEAGHRGPLDRRPSRFARLQSAQAGRIAPRAGEGSDRRERRPARRPLRGRCDGRHRSDRRGAPRARRRAGEDDCQRLRLRGLRGPVLRARFAVPPDPHRQLLRTPEPAADPRGPLQSGCRHRRPVRRRFSRGRP